MQERCEILLDAGAIQQAVLYKKNNPQWESFSLRVYIAGKGCDGFSYGVTFDEIRDEDVRIVQKSEEGHAVEVIIDPETFKFVRNSTITWVDDERGKGFLVENPRHKKFRGKFFKRAGWEERVLESED
jgi:iron-sulfur cluster assembly accessory protein